MLSLDRPISEGKLNLHSWKGSDLFTLGDVEFWTRHRRNTLSKIVFLKEAKKQSQRALLHYAKVYSEAQNILQHSRQPGQFTLPGLTNTGLAFQGVKIPHYLRKREWNRVVQILLQGEKKTFSKQVGTTYFRSHNTPGRCFKIIGQHLFHNIIQVPHLDCLFSEAALPIWDILSPEVQRTEPQDFLKANIRSQRVKTGEGFSQTHTDR